MIAHVLARFRVDGQPRPLAKGCLRSALFLAAWCSATLVPALSQAQPQVSVERSGEAYRVSVTVEVPGERDLAWQVLTDYDNPQRFVPGMRSSRIVSGAGQPKLLEQIGESGLLFIRVSTQLTSRIVEVPKSEIRFEQVKGSFKRMAGSWTLERHDHATRVAYRAEVVPEFALPPLIGPAVMASNIRVMIDGVVREIERRGAIAGMRVTDKPQPPQPN